MFTSIMAKTRFPFISSSEWANTEQIGTKSENEQDLNPWFICHELFLVTTWPLPQAISISVLYSETTLGVIYKS